MEPADDWIDLNWAEARMTLRDVRGKPYNYVAGAALPGERCLQPRVCHTSDGKLGADPAVRLSPPISLVLRDEQLGTCYLFAWV